ncbi:dihydrolipoamide acetyltransferase family protein [Cupriavidus nantongensis]|uniref:Dihydrolipoamide acetyltransferase component of pyruvate dehydrogenase complex n=1 Tax=Cupriavidus nantongensis TaxID=1796606 RepID=A0A142JQJ9_9BURK|nr:dihydrolipoamide acetyltransferase family protein [Cupriavidus nantongensis]AMR80361.1 hypothetical protein A2G96_16655 [Cupriavidus nantongensis]
MPKLGLTMTEGALVEWMLSPGSEFRVGDGLFVVETDKVANEISADADGKLLEVIVGPGDIVPVGTVLGYFDDGKAGEQDGATATAAVQAGEHAKLNGASTLSEPKVNPKDEKRASPAAQPSQAARVVATPLARRLAAEMGVSLASVNGTGPRGRIKAADVRTAASTLAEVRRTGETEPMEAKADIGAAKSSVVQRTRPTPTQLTIARRLTQAKQQVPHFYLSTEAEVSALIDLRRSLNDIAGYPKVTLTHLLVSAVARALSQMPTFNRVWEDESIIDFPTVDVGVAVNTERGLLVPVVRDIGSRSFREMVFATSAAIDKARGGKLTGEDMAGGAISISNAGMHDVTYMTSIINPGQSTILGVGSVREVFRPDEQGQPALRREMGLVLAADHRLFDGVSSLAFLQAIVSGIENPLGLVA